MTILKFELLKKKLNSVCFYILIVANLLIMYIF